MDKERVKSTGESVIEGSFSKYPPLIRKELSEFIPKKDFKLYRMIRYHMGFEDKDGEPRNEGFGKLIRPSLCLFICEATGGDWKKALPAACALELVHNFSLVHDDIQDQDEERRHHPTVWQIWGVPQGINAGNALNTLSSLMLSRLSGEISDRQMLTINKILTQSILEMIEGQCMDIDFEKRLDITVPQYMEMIEKKTAALIGASFEMGAVLGNSASRDVRHLRKMGELLGLTFQIRDDWLGIWGRGDKTGKPNSSDILQKKKTLPIIHSLQNSKRTREEVIKIYDKETLAKEDLVKLRGLLASCGARSFAQEMAKDMADRALGELEQVTLPTWATDELQKLTEFLLNRER